MTNPCRMDLECLALSLFLIWFTSSDGQNLTPSFDVPFMNVTVREGMTAILPCSVKNLGKHQVIWTDQWSTLLTFEDRRIIDDERLSVERPYTRDWNLHIRAAKHSDQGGYNCQINTTPVKIKTVHLKVQVPAKINHDVSSEDITVREGDTVTLICNVSGIPTPTITWYRHRITDDDVEKERIGMSGEVLLIHNVTRYCGDTYECVAFNGVPPAANRLIKVTVDFPPEVRLPNKRIGQVMGKETILECMITANPLEISYWSWKGQEIQNSAKHRIELYNDADNTITLSLRIRVLDKEDFGEYTCSASNILGGDSESMVLYDYKAYRQLMMTTSTTTTTTTEPTTTDPRLRWQVEDQRYPPHVGPNGHNTDYDVIHRVTTMINQRNQIYSSSKGRPVTSTGTSGRDACHIYSVLTLVFIFRIVL
ncbi:limbic system-associated membrane protein-like [Haliotis asinina]|uniref:limbic system-associated membrane protein-like n=1 Tax=Haliotis asinina TaxID=109174 RepID=UPI00353235F0